MVVGPQRVDITVERENTAALPDQPGFLKGARYDPINPGKWYGAVLPYLSKCTFIVASTADVTYAGAIFSSTALPHIYNAVTKLQLPNFYWFSGVAHNRHHNPYLQMCLNLPNLCELSLTVHPAGLTSQRWAERQIVVLEATNPEAAKERILLPLREVVRFYELDALFACRMLQNLRLEYIESPMITHFCTVGNPMDVAQGIEAYLEQGFYEQGMQVDLELVRIDEKAA